MQRQRRDFSGRDFGKNAECVFMKVEFIVAFHQKDLEWVTNRQVEHT